MLIDLLSDLEPILAQQVIVRLKHYALQTWYKTLKEKNRKLLLDLNIQNETSFSDTFLFALYQSPLRHITNHISLIPGLNKRTTQNTLNTNLSTKTK